MCLFKFVLLSLLFIACTANKEKEGEVVLNIYDIGKVKGLDPMMADDRYAGQETSRVYEGLLAFHYLKRPYVLIPALAENLPVVSEDGLTYTFTIKKGIFFHDSEAFPQGKGRELVADDFVYSLKRLADARNNSSGWWLLQNKIKGLDEWRDKYSKAKDNAHYNELVEGMNAPDKYTLKFVLKQKPGFTRTGYEDFEPLQYPSQIGPIRFVTSIHRKFRKLYKKAKKLSEAMAIIGQFKKSNHLDPNIVDFFVTSKTYRKFAEMFLDREQIDAVDEAAILAIVPEPMKMKMTPKA